MKRKLILGAVIAFLISALSSACYIYRSSIKKKYWYYRLLNCKSYSGCEEASDGYFKNCSVDDFEKVVSNFLPNLNKFDWEIVQFQWGLGISANEIDAGFIDDPQIRWGKITYEKYVDKYRSELIHKGNKYIKMKEIKNKAIGICILFKSIEEAKGHLKGIKHSIHKGEILE